MDKLTDVAFLGRIETFGFQMAEMGRQLAFETDARLDGDYDGARMYAERAEMYRQSAYNLKKDIADQIAMRSAKQTVSV